MKCPACDNELTEMSVEDIVVDVCKDGCAGIWFDNFEIEKFDEPHEHAGEGLLDIERKEGLILDLNTRRKCPKCEDVVMMQNCFSVKQKVTVDECPQCAGFWLDAGELRTIRGLYSSEEERKKAADEYFAELYDGSLAKMKAKDDENRAKARKIAHAFRLIFPSYYIPGKQTWGAF